MMTGMLDVTEYRTEALTSRERCVRYRYYRDYWGSSVAPIIKLSPISAMPERPLTTTVAGLSG
jgi:hypothetical protein